MRRCRDCNSDFSRLRGRCTTSFRSAATRPLSSPSRSNRRLPGPETMPHSNYSTAPISDRLPGRPALSVINTQDSALGIRRTPPCSGRGGRGVPLNLRLRRIVGPQRWPDDEQLPPPTMRGRSIRSWPAKAPMSPIAHRMAGSSDPSLFPK